MPKFKTVIICTVDTDSYENALIETENVVNSYDPKIGLKGQHGIISDLEIETYFEVDDHNQRVLYLHPTDTHMNYDMEDYDSSK